MTSTSNKEFHPDDDERIERIVSEVISTIGTKGAQSLLLDGDPERAVEPIPEGGTRNMLKDIENPNEQAIREIVNLSNAVGDLESWIVSGESTRIRVETERGTMHSVAVERAMNRLPGWLAERLLYEEIDILEGSGFSYPSDYEDLLGLRQIEADWFGGDQNRAERKQLWDEVLKFSGYRVEVTYNGGETYITRGYSQTPSAVHNHALTNAQRDAEGAFDFENAETTVEELFMPDTDPLDDLEAFVYRW